ncbi:beta-1,3-galactosyltransferase 5-like [Mytilus californianus]|uniref:beta-1,3-galactosyltransferase 5-like n=1 Tax=Mytilus californianus TaxID=6549 RepID=UPI002244FDC5|nr:beta-1,3-galactosyltransferase 5-like [Mytilus californianus]
MVKNVIILVKQILKSGFTILVTLFVLHLIWNSTADTETVNKRDIRKPISIAETETTTFDSVTTTEDTFTTEKTTEKVTFTKYQSFKYIHLPLKICELDGGQFDPFLLIVVKSSALQIGNREAIRTTWAKFNNPNIKLVFLLGYSPLIKQYINMEYNLYKDIVQQNFIDDYFNNTLKTIMGLDWTVTHCPKSKFIFFVDDDYFVNLPKLLNYIDFHVRKQTKNLIAGHKYIGAIPKRKTGSKWYVSWQDYPEKTWPPYLSGGSMVMAMSVAKLLKEQIPYTKPLFIDDVFLGIVAKSLNIELWNERKFSVSYVPDRLGYLFSAHRYGSPKNLISEWKRVRCNHKKLFQQLYGSLDC